MRMYPIQIIALSMQTAVLESFACTERFNRMYDSAKFRPRGKSVIEKTLPICWLLCMLSLSLKEHLLVVESAEHQRLRRNGGIGQFGPSMKTERENS